VTRCLPFVVLLLAIGPREGGWTSGPVLPVARSEAAVVTLDDRIYVIGGYVSGSADQSLVQEFQPDPGCPELAVRGEWRDVAPLPRGVNHIGAAAFRGKIYAFGGFAAEGNSPVANAEVYDPATNRWSPIAPLPHALGSISVAVLGDEIHLVGGHDTRSVGTHLVYDPVTGRYSTRAPLPVGRDHMGLVGYGDLYAVGGRVDTSAHNTSYVDIYDPSTNTWRSGARMPTARSGMAVALYSGEIFAIGGEQAGMSQAFATNEAYDPTTDRWSSFTSLPEGRHGTGAAVVGGRLYVPAGAAVPGGGRQTNTLLAFVVPDELCREL
jgi:N-acetylneuraminic acid mutarotase